MEYKRLWISYRILELEKKATNQNCNSIFWLEDCYYHSQSLRLMHFTDTVLDEEMTGKIDLSKKAGFKKKK